MARDSNGGIDLLGVVFITLIILRLFGIINISWWWVFSPLIIEAVILVILILITSLTRNG